MKNFEDLKCLIIDDKHDNIKGAREALISLGLVRSNIFPNNDDEIWFSDELKEKSNEILFPFLKTIIEKQKIDFILLDMKWKIEEKPPCTSGEQFTFYLEKSSLNKIPIIGFSIYGEAEIKTSLSPVFYIQKDGGDMPPSKVVTKFKNTIGINALLRICNSNNYINNLQNTIQEQKVIIHIFVDHVHSSNTKIIKEELEANDLYNSLPMDEQKIINTLVEYSKTPDLIHATITKVLADPNSLPAIANVLKDLISRLV